MNIIEVGVSELPGRTFRKVQTMERAAGLQAIGFMNEVQRQTSYRLTPNEGRRSRPDQRVTWNEFALYLAGRGPWAPRAAVCYTSIHDEINHGNAIDFGGPGGEVIPADVHALMVTIGALFGVVWTGARFDEWWHFEVYVNQATIRVPEGTTRLSATPPAPPIPMEDNVQLLIRVTGSGDTFGVGPQFLTHFDNAAFAQRMANYLTAEDKILEVGLPEAQAIFGAFHVPWNYANAKVFRAAAPSGQWDSRGPVAAL